jgi:hypothetical protein
MYSSRRLLRSASGGTASHAALEVAHQVLTGRVLAGTLLDDCRDAPPPDELGFSERHL